MSLREKLRESTKKGGLSNSELHHPSRAYERHFEGYVETPQPVSGKKRSKSVRTYVDSIWVQDLTPKGRVLLRVLYAVLYLISLPPFLYSATRVIPANMVWYVTLPQAFSVFALGWTALNLYRYLTLPPVMTVRQHRLGVLWLRRTGCAAWIALALCAVTYAVHAVVEYNRMNTLCALFTLFSSACLFALFLVERSVLYTEQPNPNATE